MLYEGQRYRCARGNRCRGSPQQDATANPSSRRPGCRGGVRYCSFPHCSVPELLSLPVGGTEGIPHPRSLLGRASRWAEARLMSCPSRCLRAETLPGQEQSARIPSGVGSLGLVSQGRGLFQGQMVSSSPFGSRASRGHRLFLLGTSSVSLDGGRERGGPMPCHL